MPRPSAKDKASRFAVDCADHLDPLAGLGCADEVHVEIDDDHGRTAGFVTARRRDFAQRADEAAMCHFPGVAMVRLNENNIVILDHAVRAGNLFAPDFAEPVDGRAGGFFVSPAGIRRGRIAHCL